MAITISGSGQVPVQLVQSVLTAQQSTTSNSMVDSGLTLNITPKNSANKVLVSVSMVLYNTSGYSIGLNLVRNGTAVGQGTASTNTNSTAATIGSYTNQPVSLSFSYLDSPSSTSLVTYKVQYRTQSGGTAYINAGAYVSGGSDTYQSGYISTITAQEISGA